MLSKTIKIESRWKLHLTTMLTLLLVSSGLSAQTISFENLAVEIKGAEQSRCQVELKYPHGSKVTHFSLNDPARLVIDVSAVLLKSGKKFALPTNRCLNAVRFGLHPEATRIVLDLADPKFTTYIVTEDKGELSFALDEGAETSPQQLPPQLGEKKEQSLPVTQTIPKVSVPAELRFKVDQVLVELPTGKISSQNVTVTNVSSGVLRMTAKAFSLKNPGTEEEEEVPTKELLVSPLMFELAPGEQRKVRVVGPPPSPMAEQSYRLHLVPLQGEFDPNITVNLKGLNSKFNIVTALAILVLRPPEVSSVQLIQTKTDKKLILKNDGNQSIALSEIKSCRTNSPQSSSSCRDLPNRRLFPGNTWELALNNGQRLQMLQRSGPDFQSLQIEGE